MVFNSATFKPIFPFMKRDLFIKVSSKCLALANWRGLMLEDVFDIGYNRGSNKALGAVATNEFPNICLPVCIIFKSSAASWVPIMRLFILDANTSSHLISPDAVILIVLILLTDKLLTNIFVAVILSTSMVIDEIEVVYINGVSRLVLNNAVVPVILSVEKLDAAKFVANIFFDVIFVVLNPVIWPRRTVNDDVPITSATIASESIDNAEKLVTNPFNTVNDDTPILLANIWPVVSSNVLNSVAKPLNTVRELTPMESLIILFEFISIEVKPVTERELTDKLFRKPDEPVIELTNKLLVSTSEIIEWAIILPSTVRLPLIVMSPSTSDEYTLLILLFIYY